VSAAGQDDRRADERAARLRAMGHVLDEAGSDEEIETTSAPGQGPGDAALRREVPPHHGG
jgi:hypothetical protein